LKSKLAVTGEGRRQKAEDRRQKTEERRLFLKDFINLILMN
jgi:hypothetical protein